MDVMGAFSWPHANGIPPHAQTHRRKPHNPRNMLVEFDGVGKCVILGRLLRKIKKYPKIKDKNFGNTKIMRIFAA